MIYNCIFIKLSKMTLTVKNFYPSLKIKIVIYYYLLLTIRQVFFEYFIFFFQQIKHTIISYKNLYYTCTTAGKSDAYVPGGIEPLTDIFCLLSLSMAPSFCTSGVGILGLPLAFICPLILFEPKSKTHNIYDNVYTVHCTI